MAALRPGSAPPAPGSAGRRRTPSDPPRPAVAAADRPDEEMRTLLREATWSRMFGKTGAKNPFVRRRG